MVNSYYTRSEATPSPTLRRSSTKMLPLLFVLALHAEIKSVVADGSQLSSIPAQTFADAAARFGATAVAMR